MEPTFEQIWLRMCAWDEREEPALTPQEAVATYLGLPPPETGQKRGTKRK